MKSNLLKFTKIFLTAFLSLFLVLGTIIPVQNAYAADKRDDNCPVGISIAASPSEVKSWSNVVTITTTVNRNHGFGYFCSTTDTVNITIYYLPQGANEVQVLRTGTITIPPDQTGVGENVLKRDTFQVQFSARGFTNQVSLGLSASAVVRRAAGEKISNFNIETAQGAGVRLNSKTTIPQTNAPTNSGGAPTNSGGPTNNSNTPGVNGSAGGTVPDTGVTANVGDLDGDLGILWNPLDFETVPQLITAILRILFVLIGIAAVVVIIIAGFRMVLASGNEEELTKAKKAITWAIVGLIVSLMSFSIVAIIQRLIQVGN